MNETLITKVLERYHLHESAHILSNQLNTSELTTFLTHVFSQRIENTTPAQLRQAMIRDRFVIPSSVSPRTFHAFDSTAFDLLPAEFELVELSPLAPLGTVSALASVDHGLVVHTIRSTDVTSDCTNVLALIAAARRHDMPSGSRSDIHLVASQRLVRAQAPQQAKHTAHFKILTLVSAGRDTGSFQFEQQHLQKHLRYYISLLRSFPSTKDLPIDIVIKEYAETGIDWEPCISALYAHDIRFDYQRLTRENWNYYSPFQFNINIHSEDGIFNLGDGGIVDWTQKLLSDKKERLLISGFGTELFCKLFMEK